MTEMLHFSQDDEIGQPSGFIIEANAPDAEVIPLFPGAVREHSDLDDDVEDDAPVAEAEQTFMERERAIHEITGKYRNHPKVAKEVNAIRLPMAHEGVAVDEVQHFKRIAQQFPLLDGFEAEAALFSHIDEGLRVHRLMDGIDAPTSEEEEALIKLTTAQQIAFLTNIRLVMSIASKYEKLGTMPYIDLISEGNIGLNRAICRFDHTRGFKFSTYATQWIQQRVTRVLAEQSRVIRMPVGAHEKWLSLRYDIRQLADGLGRMPAYEEVAEKSGMKLEDVKLYMQMGPNHLPSFDAPVGDGSELTLGEVLDDSNRYATDRREREADIMHARTEVARLFEEPTLSAREKLILALRAGAFDSIPEDLEVRDKDGNRINYKSALAEAATYDGMTLDKIGKILGINRERVRQISKVAIEKAQQALMSSYND